MSGAFLATGNHTLESLRGKRLALIASTGGHLAQLDKVARLLELSNDSLWITFDNAQSRSIVSGRRSLFVPYIPSRGFSGVARAFPAIHAALRADHPDGALSTGAALALAGLPAARLVTRNVHYLESVSRFDGPSLSGRILAGMPGITMHTQHKMWANARWRYEISLLDDYEADRQREARVRNIFVTLGTIKPYRFDRLLDRLGTIVPGDVNVRWQLGVTTRSDLGGDIRASMTAAEFDASVDWADVVVSHAGVGSAMRILDLGKRPVLIPRRSSYREHVDDHQFQIARELAVRGLATVVEADAVELHDLEEASMWSTRQGPRQ